MSQEAGNIWMKCLKFVGCFGLTERTVCHKKIFSLRKHLNHLKAALSGVTQSHICSQRFIMQMIWAVGGLWSGTLSIRLLFDPFGHLLSSPQCELGVLDAELRAGTERSSSGSSWRERCLWPFVSVLTLAFVCFLNLPFLALWLSHRFTQSAIL